MLGRVIVAAAAVALVPAGGVAAQTPVPPTIAATTLVVTGHGYGHGIGMSQWGASGYAQHGWTYDRILAHYYPGAQLGPAPVTSLRILLAEGRKAVTVSSTAPWRAIDGAGQAHELPAGRAVLRANGTLTASDGTVDPAQVPLPVTFAPRGSPLTYVHAYRGTIQVRAGAGGKLIAVNVLGLEAYLKGVVPAEMPVDWSPEALKAQAVAARSYALANRAASRPFDLYSDVRSQAYLGLSVERPSSNAAVDTTRGQVLLYRGQVANALFFSTSGGRTISYAEAFPGSKAFPYLASVDDPYDDASPYHDWGPVLVDGAKAAKGLGLTGSLLDLETRTGASGRVATAIAHGTKGDVTLTGSKARFALGLRSTWFTTGLLSLRRPYGPVPYGSPLTVTGAVRDAGEALSLEQRAGSTAWQPGASVSPDAGGSFSVVLRPTVTTELRLVAGTVRSAVLKVTVAPVVTLATAEDATALTGTTKPAVAESTVEIQRQDGIVWTTAATAAADASGSFSVALPLAPGTYRARFAPGHGLVAGTSPPLVLQ